MNNLITYEAGYSNLESTESGKILLKLEVRESPTGLSFYPKKKENNRVDWLHTELEQQKV